MAFNGRFASHGGRTIQLGPELADHAYEELKLALLGQRADLTIELMGGCEPAREVITQALNNSRDVVTANKELMANESKELEDLAHSNGLLLKCSASVGGGLPAIESIKRISSNAPVMFAPGLISHNSSAV